MWQKRLIIPNRVLTVSTVWRREETALKVRRHGAGGCLREFY